MNNDEKILKALEDLKADVTVIKDVQQKQGKQIDMLVDTAGHMNTALKAVATKQDVEVAVDAAKSELKADILMLDSKVVKKIQRLDRHVTNIEEHEGIENPDKN